MKILFTVLCFLGSTIFLFSQTNSKEEVAIRKVIEEAGNGAYTNNYEQWSKHFLQTDILFHYAYNGGHYLYQDWRALAAQMKENMSASPNQSLPYVERTNFIFRIDNTLAWVHFDQKDDNRLSKEQRVLVKENDKWKIVNMTAINVSSFEEKPKAEPIQRILYFSYKEDTPADEIENVKNKFQEMVSLIDGMEKAVWMESPDADSPFRYSLLLEFLNEEALKSYETHANHQAAIEVWKQYGGTIWGHTTGE